MSIKIDDRMVTALTKYKKDEVLFYITKDSWGMDSWQIYDPTLTVPKEILESDHEKRVLRNKPLSDLYLSRIHLYIPAKVKKLKSDKTVVALYNRKFVSLANSEMYQALLKILKQMYPGAKLTPYIYQSDQTYTPIDQYKPIIIRAGQKVVCVFMGVSLKR